MASEKKIFFIHFPFISLWNLKTIGVGPIGAWMEEKYYFATIHLVQLKQHNFYFLGGGWVEGSCFDVLCPSQQFSVMLV